MRIKIASDLQKYTSFVSEYNTKGSTLGDSLQELFNEFPQFLVFLVADNSTEAKKTTLKLNDEYVFEIAEAQRKVTIEDILEIAQDLPEGDDGVGKVILGAALIVASFYVPALWAYAPQISAGLFGMGASLALGGAAELIMGKPQLPTMDTGGDSPTYNSFSGIKNTTASGTTIPVVYGKHRVGGQLVSTYLDVVGGYSYLRAQIGLCEGPLREDFVDINSIKINNLNFFDIPKYDKQVNIRRGTRNQEAPESPAWLDRVGTLEEVDTTFTDVSIGNTPVLYTSFAPCTSVTFTITDKSIYFKGAKGQHPYSTVIIEESVGSNVWKLNTSLNHQVSTNESFTITATFPDKPKVRILKISIPTIIGYPNTKFEWVYEFPSIVNSVTISSTGEANRDTLPEMDFFATQTTTIDYSNQLLAYDINYDIHTANTYIGNSFTTTSAVNSVDLIMMIPVIYSSSGSAKAKVEYDIYWKSEKDLSYSSDKKVSDFIDLLSKVEYEQVTRIEFPTTDVYNIKVVRVTPKHTTFDIQDDLYIKALNENVTQGQIYPHTALMGVHLKANDLVDGGMPTITSEIYGVQVPVPVGYISNDAAQGVQRYMSASWNGLLTNDPSLTLAINTTCVNDSDIITVSSTTGLAIGKDIELDVNELRYKITAISGNNVTLDRKVIFRGSGTTILRNKTKYWTNNPVWCLYDLLTNERYGLSRYYQINPAKKGLVLANFFNMALECDQYVFDNGDPAYWTTVGEKTNFRYKSDGVTKEYPRPKFSLDLVMDSAKKAAEWVNIICAAMQASVYYSEGMVWLDIDRPKAYTQIFNMSNITNYTQTGASAKSIPNVLEVQFINKNKDYEQDSFLLESTELANDLSIEERRKSIQLYGVTDERQARSLAYYILQSARLALTTVSFKTGSNGLLSSVGDVVAVQHDVPQWGYGGRVVAYNSTTRTITLSDPVTFLEGYTYQLMISHEGLQPEYAEIVTQAVGTVTSTVVLTAVNPLWDLVNPPQEGDVYVIGDINNVSKPFRIVSLKRDSDDLVEVTAIEYDSAIYEASLNSNNLGNSGDNYSLLLKPSRSVKNVLAEAHIYTDTTGNLKTGAMVYYTPIVNNLTWQGVIVYYGIGGSYSQMPIDRAGVVMVPEISIEGDYQFLCVSVFSDGTRQSINEVLDDLTNTPFYSVHITPFIENTEFLKGVSGLQLTNQGNNLIFVGKDAKFSWRKPSAADYNLNNIVSDKPLGVDTPNSWLRAYQVTIRNLDGSLRYTTKVYDEYFEYKYEQNYKDGGGTPARSFIVDVEAIDRLGRYSNKSSISVSNPSPDTIT